MQKGNIAICNAAYAFSWTACDTVELHDGNKYIWERTNISINMVTNECCLDGNVLPHKLNIKDIQFSKKARQLVSIIPKLFSDGKSPIKQFQRPVSLTQESDSSDEHRIDPAEDPAFDEVYWDLVIVPHFRALQMYYKRAVTCSFDNAGGKYFIASLMQFASLVKQERMQFVSMGTNPSGECQPGCSNLTKKVAKYRNERTPTPSSSRSSTPDNYVTSSHSNYSDVVSWDPVAEVYTINTEVKSANEQSSDTQIIDQMVGQFRATQKNQLGCVIKSGYTDIYILRKFRTKLRLMLYEKRDLNLKEYPTIQLLCELFIAFICFL